MSDTNELAEIQRVEAVSANPLSIIRAVASDPNCDVDKLERLMGLQERYEANEACKAYGHAIAGFQSKCPIIQKAKKADRYSYAGYDDIMVQIRPVLAEYGLSVSFSSGQADAGKLSIEITLQHGTHSETKRFSFPVPEQMRVNDTQKMGAALSYARRYALCGALNIVVSDEDMDAAGLESVQPPSADVVAARGKWKALVALRGDREVKAAFTGLFGKTLDDWKNEGGQFTFDMMIQLEDALRQSAQ